MRKLKIDPDDLASAFEDHSDQLSWYLDTETGEVLAVTYDTSRRLEELSEDEADPIGGDLDDLLRRPEDDDFQAWEAEDLKRASEIAFDTRGRFLPIPGDDSHDAYRDMVGFAEEVEDQRLQELLAVALDGRGAFRRFKDVLLAFPEEREDWFRFKAERLQARMLDWLNSEGIDVIWERRGIKEE